MGIYNREKNHLEAADKVAPSKRLNSLLKLTFGLMAGIWAGRELHNLPVVGRNDLARLTRFCFKLSPLFKEVHCFLHENKQTNKQTIKQTNKQTNKQKKTKKI